MMRRRNKRMLQVLFVLQPIQLLVVVGFSSLVCHVPWSSRVQRLGVTTTTIPPLSLLSHIDRHHSILLDQKSNEHTIPCASSIRNCRSVQDVIVLLNQTAAAGVKDPISTKAAAMRRLVDFSSSRYLSIESRTLAQDTMIRLLQDMDEMLNHENDPPLLTNFNPHVLTNVLIALGTMQQQVDNTFATSSITQQTLTRLADRVCTHMANCQDRLVRTLRPHRLVDCLQAMSSLQLDASQHSSLIGCICHRLQQGDSLAVLEARHLANGIKAIVMMIDEGNNVVVSENNAMLQSFMRRYRKQAIRRTATNVHVCQTLYAARRLLKQNNDTDLEDDHGLIVETTTTVYTLLRELCSHPLDPFVVSRSLMTAGQVAETLMTATAFRVNVTNPIYNHLMSTLSQDDRSLERASISDIARILLSMERSNLCDFPSVVQRLGYRFQNLVHYQERVEPKSACSILRCSLRLHSRNDTVMEPYKKAATFLLVEHNDDSFLQTCSDMELSTLVRFLCQTRCDDETALIAVAERILQPDIVVSCSPVAASRILTYFTSLIDTSTDDLVETLRPRLSEMFGMLGTHMQTAQLPAAETSAAMQAYAKASYVQDMDTFHHLAIHLATSLDDCSVRHVTQSLWACGKMMVFESDHYDCNDAQQSSGPPYMQAADTYATHLASRVTELTAKDVAQAVWALGRLRIDDAKVVCAIAFRGCQVASELSSLEVANTLWGLARVGFDNRNVISVLKNRMLELRPTSQEAATVLYALGRLGLGDELFFSAMSDVMMAQLETASAQAIANALWAFRTVHIPPPRELMDSWVVQKLGMDLNTTTTTQRLV